MHVCPDIVYVCAIVVTLNACKCVHTCVCVPVWTQCPACVAIEWSYGLCPASILVLLLASECMAAPAGSGTITPFPLPHPKPPLLSLGVTMPLFGSTHHPETRRPLGKNWPGCGCHTATGTQRSWGGQREGKKKKAGNMKRRGFLLGNMGRGSVCWISESCGQYYPISCDSLTQEMRRLWWKEKPGWNSENIQLRPSETIHRSFFSCFSKKNKT